MSETPEKLLYKDWLNLIIHLLWSYDHKVIQDPGAIGVRSYTEYTNNGAWLVRRGWAEVEVDGQTMRAEPGQWLIIKPGKRTQRFAAETWILSVAFDARWPDGGCLLDNGLSVVLDAAAYPKLEQAALPMVKAFETVSRQGWNIFNHAIGYQDYFLLESLLANWLSELIGALANVGVEYSGKTEIDQRVMKAVRILRSLPVSEAIDPAILANACNISEAHLLRLFRTDLGTSPRKFFTRLRLEHACRQLRMPDVRIKEVAQELGFRHMSHFSRWFQAHAGCSPRDYVARNRLHGHLC